MLTLDESATDEQNKWGRLIFFGLPQGSDRGRALAVGDLDGDKRKDIVVTDPANAQIWLYRQGARSGLNAGQSFPGLLGGRAVHLADLDHDGKDEVYVLSEQEKQIGKSTMEQGRVSFPTPLPITGEPVAMDLADLDGDKTPELLYLDKGKSPTGSDTFQLRSLKREPSGSFKAFAWGGSEATTVGLSSPPTDMKALDVNADSLTDIMVFTGYGSPVLLLGQPKGPPKAFTGSLGPMAAATPAGLSTMDLGEQGLDRGPEHLRAASSARLQGAMGDQGTVQLGAILGPDPGSRCARCRRRRQEGDRPAGSDQQVAPVPVAEGRRLPARRHALGRVDRV